MDKQLISKKLTALILFLCVLVSIYLFYLIFESGVVSGADSEIDRQVEKLKSIEESRITTEGSFLDRNNILLTNAGEPGESSDCLYPELYGYIIGYNSQIYGLSGLRNLYANELFRGGSDHTGAFIRLTIDHDMQSLCYNLLGRNVGSIIVAETKTGKILAMVSRGDEDIEYNVNLIDENFQLYNEIDEFFYNRAVLSQDPPGSIFKIITATALLENNMGDLTYTDTGDYYGIRNAGYEVYGELSLADAMIHSANTFFAYCGDVLGREKLARTAEKFFLGMDIPLDFTAISSSIGLDDYSNADVAHTAFGQGNLMVSALNLLMIIQAVANNGRLIKPYLIDAIIDNGRENIKETEILGIVASDSTISILEQILNKTAANYGFQCSKRTVIAKTGTAEVYNSDSYHTYLAFATEDISGIISLDRTDKPSSDLIPIANSILNYIYE